MKTLCVLLLYTTAVTELCWMGQASTSSCRVYPSEYAYHNDSVIRSERPSANCRIYPADLASEHARTFSEHYIHCNGTQLRLSDSGLGPQSLYNNSYYYEWSAGSETRQLLFIFPTRVNLTTITLHYYSSHSRGLPALGFFAVPDDFNVWDTPSGIFVELASVQIGVEPVGRTSVNASFNINTQKILMVKAGSTYKFAVSEVEFFDSTCPSNESIVNQVTTESTSNQPMPTTTMRDERTTVSTSATTGPISGGSEDVAAVSIRELVAWLLVAILLVLSMVLLSLLLLHCLYKKRQQLARTDVEDKDTKYEMEGNVCYEATQVKQTSGEGPHIYEAVKGGGAK